MTKLLFRLCGLLLFLACLPTAWAQMAEPKVSKIEIQHVGPQEVSVPLPQWLSGAWEPAAGIQLPLNRIFIIGLTAVVAVACTCCSPAHAGGCACVR